MIRLGTVSGEKVPRVAIGSEYILSIFDSEMSLITSSSWVSIES